MAFPETAPPGVPLYALSHLKAGGVRASKGKREGEAGRPHLQQIPSLKSLPLSRSNPGGGCAGGKSNLHREALQGPGTNSEVKHVNIQWPHLPTLQCPPLSFSWCPFLPQLPFRIWPSPLFALPSVQTLTGATEGECDPRAPSPGLGSPCSFFRAGQKGSEPSNVRPQAANKGG